MPQAAHQLENNDLSFSGKRWKLRATGYREGAALARSLGVPEVVGRVLANRGITEAKNPVDAAATFLSPAFSQLPPPGHLLDIDIAVERLATALKKSEQLAIFGDYDVDGSCGAALLLRYFRSLGTDPLLYIPDRLSEGYGPNPAAMEKLAAQGAKVLITVDCGCTAFAAMEAAQKAGLDVIITDHHQTKPEKPPCLALINPNRVDETSPAPMLSGAGVAFYLLMALNTHLRQTGFFSETLPEPDLKTLLDLVAVATVCDMVPLTGPNRVLVDRGLKILGTRQNPGLSALMAVAGLEGIPQAWHAGFSIGPRINAGGRISECDLGARLLSSTDERETITLAQRLHLLNEERKEIENTVLQAAMTQAERIFREDLPALVLSGEGWHPGVIGIVASRVKATFHRPVFVMGIDGGMAKGSGRSISGIDLGRAVLACGELLLSGGGHKMAAGVSLKTENLPAFTDKLCTLVAEQAAKAEDDVFTPSLSVDGLLTPGGANIGLMEVLERLAPFGTGNPEPSFAFTGVTLARARAVGADGSHVSFSFKDETGTYINGIAFRAMESPLGAALLGVKSAPVSLLGTLQRNLWQGRESVQLHLSDARPGRWQPT